MRRRSTGTSSDGTPLSLGPDHSVGKGHPSRLPAEQQSLEDHIGVQAEGSDVLLAEQGDEVIDDDVSRHLIDRCQDVCRLCQYDVGDLEGILLVDNTGRLLRQFRRVSRQIANNDALEMKLSTGRF